MKRAADGDRCTGSARNIRVRHPAQDAEMSLAEYEDFVFRGRPSRSDADPVLAVGNGESANGRQRLVDFLNGKIRLPRRLRQWHQCADEPGWGSHVDQLRWA